MTTRRKTTLCVEAWYYLVVMSFILAGALLREINLLIVLFGMMAGPLLYNWRSVIIGLRGLEVRRKVPRAVQAGDLLVVELEMTNTRRRGASWAIVTEDTIRRTSESAISYSKTGQVLFSHIAASATRKSSYQGRLGWRGRYTFGPLRLTTRFPLGLVRRTIVLEEPKSSLIVYPRLGRLTVGWTRRYGDAAQGSRRTTNQQGLMEGDYHGLREFRPGDSRRWIHWRTTARRGALMVRQFEQQRNQDLCLLVELWRPNQPTDEELAAVELAVSFAATVISERCRRAGNFMLTGTAAAENTLTRGPASSALLQETLETLAVAEGTADDRLPLLLSEALDTVQPGTNIVVISTRPTQLAAPRFATLWADPRKKNWAGKILAIDASSSQLDEFFQVE
jgi:uncharacterized protein (DUF58 family)